MGVDKQNIQNRNKGFIGFTGFILLKNKTLKTFKTEIKVLSVLRVLFIKNKALKTFKTENKGFIGFTGFIY